MSRLLKNTYNKETQNVRLFLLCSKHLNRTKSNMSFRRKMQFVAKN